MLFVEPIPNEVLWFHLVSVLKIFDSCTVLSTDMDERKPSSEYGFCAALVSELHNGLMDFCSPGSGTT